MFEDVNKSEPEKGSLPLRVLRVVAGWVLLVVGLAGFVLPIIPGVPLLLGGLALLSYEYAWAARWRQKVTDGWHRLRGKA